jgi:hypothetical protein
LAGQAGVHDRGDALDRDRGFRHVGGQHDLAAAQRPQGGVLLLGRQVAVEGQHRQVARRRRAFQGPGRLADFLHAGEKNEQIAGRGVEQPGRRRRGRLGPRLFLGLGIVAHRHREGPPLAGDHRAAAEVGGDGGGVERGRHGHQAQLGPDRLLDEADQAEGEVTFQATLVELVEDDGPGGFEEGVVVEAAEEDAGRDGEDAGLPAGLAVEADVVADGAAEAVAALLGHAAGGGAGGEAARLQHQDFTGPGQAGVEQGRRHARGLAGAGRRLDHGAGPGAEGGDQGGQDGVDGERGQGHGGSSAVATAIL